MPLNPLESYKNTWIRHDIYFVLNKIQKKSKKSSEKVEYRKRLHIVYKFLHHTFQFNLNTCFKCLRKTCSANTKIYKQVHNWRPE